MQLVIEIPESVKQAFDNATEDDIYGCYYDYNSIIGRAIKNGVPLPKGHGRLIMNDDLISRAWLKEAIHNFFRGLKHVPTDEDIQAYIDAAPSEKHESIQWVPLKQSEAESEE